MGLRRLEGEERLEIWAEKYRPKTLDDIVNRESIVRRLKGFIREGNLPHLLFIGPAGSGKTAAILALAHDFYGRYGEDYRPHVLELNASDERGIGVIKGRVKSFAHASTFGGVPFKLIIMDEADNLTRDAQPALRRIMEKFSTVRFCLIGNYQSKIIEPIQSRCALFFFPPYGDDVVAARVMYIAEREGVEITDGGVKAITDLSRGDLRKAINILQAASTLGIIDESTVYEVISRVQPDEVRKMVMAALNGDFLKARGLLRDLLIGRGLSGFDMVKQIYKELFNMPAIPEEYRLELLSELGDIDYRLTQGATDEVQLSAFLARLVLTGSKIIGRSEFL
ncbi:TPA: replication factor C small subunit [Candidatus Bathyarchaeota archaeon]|nr:replication factor C small subunit [Candidatus Bathyarchaeota archaeon]